MSPASPTVSVIVLNYNGKLWIERCLQSLQSQTIFDQLEIIVTDNKSNDGSDELAAQWFARNPKGFLLQNSTNLSQWTSCVSNQLQNGQFWFTNIIAPGVSNGFYRAIAPL